MANAAVQTNAGTTVQLVYDARDILGAALGASAVSWQSARDPRRFSSLAVAEDGSFIAPSALGPFILKASWLETSGRVREKSFAFNIAPKACGVSIRFGEGGGGPNSDGEAYGEAGKGLYYGFDQELDEALGGFSAFRKISSRESRLERSGFIEVPKGIGFKLLTGPGRFEIKLLVGPYEEKGRYEAKVAGKSLVVEHSGKRVGVYEIHCEAMVGNDGILRVEGGKGLRLIELYAIALSPEAPVIAESVMAAKDYGYCWIDYRPGSPGSGIFDAPRLFDLDGDGEW
jgi:hypothetical protein